MILGDPLSEKELEEGQGSRRSKKHTEGEELKEAAAAVSETETVVTATHIPEDLLLLDDEILGVITFLFLLKLEAPLLFFRSYTLFGGWFELRGVKSSLLNFRSL